MRIRPNLTYLPNDREQVQIHTAFIRLDAFLKFQGLAQTGGHAKVLIEEGRVKVNGERCISRGKKIRPGDMVTFQCIDYEIQENRHED